jgi:Flp pilus assembly protein CpaB
MSSNRTRVIFTMGLAAFVVGAVIAGYILIGPDDAKTAPKVPVIVAAKPIVVGTTAANAAAQGLLQKAMVEQADVPENAVVSIDQLAGTVATVAVPGGTVITTDMFATAQTRIGTVKIPSGRTALALEMENVAGVAGFAGAGDKINVYGVAEADDAGTQRAVRLILSAVEVLNVNGVTLTAEPGKPGAERLIFLLAVAPAEAERLIYLSKFEQLYFSLVPKDQSGAVTTPGAGPATALKAL